MDLHRWIYESTDPGPEFIEPTRRATRTDWRDWRVDRAARRLAVLCACWAHRGRAMEDLVGVVYGCPCQPKVMPRDELAVRLPAGPLLDALTSIRVERRRLAVVAAPGYVERRYTDHWITVPAVEAPDTRGVLGKMPPGRREELARRLEEVRPTMFQQVAKELCDHGSLDALYVRTFWLDYGRSLGSGGEIGLHRKQECRSEDVLRLQAAELEVRPNKVLCIVPKEKVWEDDAIVWLEPTQLGLLENANPCTDLRGRPHP